MWRDRIARGNTNDKRSHANGLAVFGNIFLFYFPTVIGMDRADISFYIYGAKGWQEYAQYQKQ